MLGALTAADARQVCLPGTGLDCGSGAPPTPSMPSSGGGNGAAAGLGAAADIFSAIGNLLEASQSLRTAPSAQPSAAQIARRAADLNAEGLQAYAEGDFDTAITDFMSAVTAAADAKAWDLRDAYVHNYQLAQARKALSEAESLYQRGDYAAASRQYLVAAQKADLAEAKDIAAMVRAYHQRMMAAVGNGAASQGVLGTGAHCEVINGTTLCETPAAAAPPTVAATPVTPPAVAAVPRTTSSIPATTAPAKAANPKFPLSAKAASSLPQRQRWIATGSAADCAAAGSLERNTAGWYDMCVSDPERGSATTPGGKRLKTAPTAVNPAAQIPAALADLLQGLPQQTSPMSDDGRECGHWNGRRARGQCFAPWDGNSKEACEGDLGGAYYPASADNPTSFCSYGAVANPLTANNSDACADAGGQIRDGACWILGLTHSDCDDLHGKIVESSGYQYCAIDPAAVAQAEGSNAGPKPAPDDLRERLRKSLAAGNNANNVDADPGASGVPQATGTPKPPAPPPRQTAQKTMTPAEERKACAALGPKWRYDPTATYNFSPGAPPKCFPIFTENLEGEPGFATKQ